MLTLTGHLKAVSKGCESWSQSGRVGTAITGHMRGLGVAYPLFNLSQTSQELTGNFIDTLECYRLRCNWRKREILA